MKRLLSMFISIALMATSVLCVDFSAAAADDDIPNYVTFQAECYGMDDVYNVFQVGTYNHEFAQAFKKNSEFQSSVAAWETANNLLNPASAASTSFDKVQYYELMLFDIIDQASKNQNLLKYFSNRYVNYVISATKKITTTLSESDCSAALTTEKASQVTALLSQASDLSEALKQTSQIVGMSKTVIDYVLNLSRYQITFDLTSYEIDVLKMIRDNTDDTYLKAAVAEVIGYQQNAMSRTLVEAIQLAEFSVEIIFDVAVSALWSAISAPIAGLNLIYKGTKAAVNAWLATDDIISAYYSIAALDSFETTLRSCMDSLRAQFQNSATAENAERFMAAIGFYEKSALLGCDYVEKVLDAQYKKAAWSLIFKSENEMMDRYNAVENYRSVASNAFTSIEDSVNSLYVKKYFPDYDDLLSLTDQSGKYVPITGLSCTDGEVTLAVNENRYLAVSYTPTNTTETQLNYTCTDPSIATVDACGFITGVAEGTTSVTICSAADDSLSVTVPITVSGVYDPVTGKTSYTDADGNQTEVTDAHYKDYTYSVFNGAATITKYTGNARNLYVPSTLGGYPVKRINDQVFRGCNFETAVLPNQLETIGAYAFQNCVRLTSVTLPESLTAMYACVFSGCTKLKSLTVPQYVTQMHSYWNNANRSSLEESSIETVVFEGGRDSIPYSACSQATRLQKVVIPTGVVKIYNYAFYHCTALTGDGITIPTGVTWVGTYAFSGCTALTGHGVSLPDTVTGIGEGIFQNCSGITEFALPDSVKSIGDRAFAGCNFETAVLPNQLETIGAYAFQNCVRLTSVTLPESLTAMYACVFSGCTKLKSLTVPQYVTQMHSWWNNANRSSLEESSIETVVFEGGRDSIPYSACSQATRLQKVVIPTGVVKIYNYAFYHCTALTGDGITIPTGVTWVGTYAFSGCTALTGHGVSLPDTVTGIGEGIFQNCSGITEFALPDSVKSIGDRAFAGCNFETAVLPNQLETIGAYAFQNCVRLTSVTLPESLTAMYACVFSGCTKLKSLTVPQYVTQMHSWWNNANRSSLEESSIETVVFEGGRDSIPYSACSQATRLQKVVIPTGVVKIYNYAFYHCTALTGDGITIPTGVTWVGTYAFSGCTALTGHGVSLPDTVTGIGEGIFQNCSGITEFALPDSVKSIGDRAFAGCNFETAVLPNQLETIGAYAFQNCVRLTSVTLPESLTAMYACVFSGCTKLKSLTVPQYVTQMHSWWNNANRSSLEESSIETVVFEGGRDSIPYSACANVPGLTTVVIPASVQKFGTNAFYKSTAVTIHGYANTPAQTYAENNTIPFETLDCAHTNTQIKYAYPANACTDGYTGDVYCVDCGLLLQQGKTIAATGHRYIKVSETPATCTEAGVIKYMCSGCKQSYEVLIPATAHDYQSEVVAATCSQSGYTQYTCTVCGYSYRTDYTQPGAHSFVKTTVAATCTAAGYDCYTCSVCGSAYTTGFTAPLGHDLQVIQTDDQSESNGHIFEYLRCARCMDTATDTIRTTHVTDASGHYVWKAGCYQDQVVQAGDCTHKKIVVRVCTVEDPTGTGTCTAQLRTESEAPGHHVEQWTVTVDPTCSTDGLRTGSCTVCGEEVHQVIAAAPEYGHIFQYSGSEPGVCIYTCTRCGVTERRRADVVEAQFFDHMGAADKSALGYVYDLNQDGVINLRDYVLLQRIAVGGTE